MTNKISEEEKREITLSIAKKLIASIGVAAVFIGITCIGILAYIYGSKPPLNIPITAGDLWIVFVFGLIDGGVIIGFWLLFWGLIKESHPEGD